MGGVWGAVNCLLRVCVWMGVWMGGGDWHERLGEVERNCRWPACVRAGSWGGAFR
jgi:hypothetical protein